MMFSANCLLIPSQRWRTAEAANGGVLTDANPGSAPHILNRRGGGRSHGTRNGDIYLHVKFIRRDRWRQVERPIAGIRLLGQTSRRAPTFRPIRLNATGAGLAFAGRQRLLAWAGRLSPAAEHTAVDGQSAFHGIRQILHDRVARKKHELGRVALTLVRAIAEQFGKTQSPIGSVQDRRTHAGSCPTAALMA